MIRCKNRNDLPLRKLRLLMLQTNMQYTQHILQVLSYRASYLLIT